MIDQGLTHEVPQQSARLPQVDGLFLEFFTDDLHNREAVSRNQVGISSPNRTGGLI